MSAFGIRESLAQPGLWIITEGKGSALGKFVASAVGKERAEIIRAALEAKADQ